MTPPLSIQQFAVLGYSRLRSVKQPSPAFQCALVHLYSALQCQHAQVVRREQPTTCDVTSHISAAAISWTNERRPRPAGSCHWPDWRVLASHVSASRVSGFILVRPVRLSTQVDFRRMNAARPGLSRGGEYSTVQYSMM